MSIDVQENTRRIIKTLHLWLKEGSSYTTRPVRCTLNGITPATYFISVMKINSGEMFVQEIFSSRVRGQIVYRSWTFRRGEYWFIAALEHYNHAVPYTSIRPQVDDFLRRIEILLELESRGGAFFTETAAKAPANLSIDLPSDSELERTGIISRATRSFARHSVGYTITAMALGIILLLGVHVLRVRNLERRMNTSLHEYTLQVDHQVQDFITDTEDEISDLINNIHENRKNFAFDRQNAYVSVMRMGEELAGYLPARREAYKLIAGNIREASNYSEIFYEMTRLPTEEYQARIFLATDRQSVIPLARFKPAFEKMLYPVKLDAEGNDGRGFRITDGYMTRRMDPVGTGGVTPHFAVDIINVSNIAYVNHAGEIIREGNPPGNVVSTFQGRVIDIGYNSRYGWYIEIEHPLIEEVTSRYPEAQRWTTYYAHLNNSPEISVGEKVEANRVLSRIGDSGKSTGPHLHFEVRVYQDSGRYTVDGMHYDKINPYPEERSSH